MKVCTGFDTSGGIAVMAMHAFYIDASGYLRHEIDGKLRAVVPEAGFESYADRWHECKDVIDGRVFNVAIDPLKPAIQELAAVIHSDSRNDVEQIAYLQAELAKLTALQDNISSEVLPTSPQD